MAGKSKKWFAAGAAVFMIILVIASYDISRRTTFPGSKSQLKERLRKDYLKPDSQKTDSLRPKTDKF